MITTLFIDIDNTLLDFQKCAEQSVIRGFREFGIEYSPNVMPTFHKINDVLWQRIEKGELTREGLHKIRWKMVFDALGTDGDGESFEKTFVDNLHECSEPVDGAYEFLEYLSKKHTLCAASNGPLEQQKHRLEIADMLKFFSYIFVSDDIGASKPAAAFFCECLKRLGNAEKDEIMLIGDSPTADIKGGRDFGIKTCWFNYGKTDLAPDCDYVINELADIKNIL